MSGSFEQARDFFTQGLAHFQAGRFDQAERSFAASDALLPGRISTLTNLGATRLKLGKPQEAANVLEEVLAREPDNVEALGHRATALAELGHFPKALACVERMLSLVPALGHAWSLRGLLLRDLGRPDEAAAAFDEAIARGADPELNRYYRAALTGRDVPPTAPHHYVQSLFDTYADGFDEHLVQVLRYQAPQVLADGLRAMGREFACALDLGCGTGLCGPLVRPLAKKLHGVDLSATMVERAQALGVYDLVAQSDLAQYLQGTAQRYDVVLAADVFIYIGALEAVFAGVARVMEPGGVFCFSVESAEGQEMVLRDSLRYAHSRPYIEKLATQFGFGVSTVSQHPIREDQRVPVPGLYFWLTRR